MLGTLITNYKNKIMSEHARVAMFEDVEQSLIDSMSEFLDSEDHKLSEAIALIKDQVAREESELHIRMAKAALNEYKKTVGEEYHDGKGIHPSEMVNLSIDEHVAIFRKALSDIVHFNNEDDKIDFILDVTSKYKELVKKPIK